MWGPGFRRSEPRQARGDDVATAMGRRARAPALARQSWRVRSACFPSGSSSARVHPRPHGARRACKCHCSISLMRNRIYNIIMKCLLPSRHWSSLFSSLTFTSYKIVRIHHPGIEHSPTRAARVGGNFTNDIVGAPSNVTEQAQACDGAVPRIKVARKHAQFGQSRFQH